MKTQIILLFLVPLIITYSCTVKEDNEPSVNSKNQCITPDGVLSGTISNYAIGKFDILKVSDIFNFTILNSCTVSSDGKFSMSLPIPSLNTLSEVGAFPNAILSDENVHFGGAELGYPIAYQGNSMVGYVIRSNSSIIGNANIATFFYYFDRSCTIKGSGSLQALPGVTLEYDMSVKKGWNEIVVIISSTKRTYTTTIPSGLSWYYNPK